MDLYQTISLLFTVAVAVAYLNYRFIKMPSSISIMFASLLISVAFTLLGKIGAINFDDWLETALRSINFHALLMNGMLGYLLFAAALNIDISELHSKRREIFLLATLGTVFSALIVGFSCYLLFSFLGYHLALIYCLLFGALISPTDPIAVLSILKKVGAPQSIRIYLEGESLFNDGVGIVLFVVLYQVLTAGKEVSFGFATAVFFHQVLGGIVYGVLLGFVTNRLLRRVQSHNIILLLTLAVASGGYTLAELFEFSGPLAMVVSGIMIGNESNRGLMTQENSTYLKEIWEVIDEVLNALLFVLIGFEILVVQMQLTLFLGSLLVVVLVLIARACSVVLPLKYFAKPENAYPNLYKILIWGGLRGGLAVALALSLPEGKAREAILSLTYFTVAFSILVQGMTIKSLLKKTMS